MILLGAIGDDMTGSTDLALMLGKHGMPVIQYIGVPRPDASMGDAKAAVIALKSRTAPVEQAVSDSMAASDWLVKKGARQIFFKYCSTFDSTPRGNIGPVAEALLDRLASGITIYCPAFPQNGRTLYNGHLFVGMDLLSDSGMRHHPLTPMRDANLVRFLSRQLDPSEKVALIPYRTVDRGVMAIKESLDDLLSRGFRHVVVDALVDRHLFHIGGACEDLKLITGGSGVAMGLPDNFRLAGCLEETCGLVSLPQLSGGTAVLAGSCSDATQRQVARMASRYPSFRIDPHTLAAGNLFSDEIFDWASNFLDTRPFLIYSTAGSRQIKAIQKEMGAQAAGVLIERLFAELGKGLFDLGIRKFIVAGGETSGAVIAALDVHAVRIGPEIAPGVPWTVTEEEPKICLALKSGNFGDDDFFETAIGVIDGRAENS